MLVFCRNIQSEHAQPSEQSCSENRDVSEKRLSIKEVLFKILFSIN